MKRDKININKAKKKKKKETFFSNVVAIDRVKWASSFLRRVFVFTILSDVGFLYLCLNRSTACFPVDPDTHSPVRLKNDVLLFFIFIVLLSSGNRDV